MLHALLLALSQGEGLSLLIGLLAKISLTALLTAIYSHVAAELVIESVSGSAGFGSTLSMFSSLDGSIHLKYFSSAIF